MRGQPGSPGRGYEEIPDGGSRKGKYPNTRQGSIPTIDGANGRVSSGYIASTDAPAPRDGSSSRLIEGQKLRGYLDPMNNNLPTPKNVTISPTGPKIVRSDASGDNSTGLPVRRNRNSGQS